jgi:hypothetical protein
MKPTRTLAALIPNLRAHHLHTPKDFISKKKTIFCIIRIDLSLSNLTCKIGFFTKILTNKQVINSVNGIFDES